jgi:hypothetical protein
MFHDIAFMAWPRRIRPRSGRDAIESLAHGDVAEFRPSWRFGTLAPSDLSINLSSPFKRRNALQQSRAAGRSFRIRQQACPIHSKSKSKKTTEQNNKAKSKKSKKGDAQW